jgi:MGT family glycosyltransferase
MTARFLVYTTPAIGHLYPATGVALELRRRGHEVFVRTLASQVDLVRRLGLEAKPIDEAIERITMDDWKAKGPLDAVGSALGTLLARAPLEVADVQRAIDDVSPDALFVDINAWGAGTWAEASGLPWASFAPFPLPLPSRDVPPFGPGLTPRRGPFGALRDAIVRRVQGRVVRRALPGLNRVRASVGLAPLPRLEAQLVAASRVISFTAEPFEYARSDWPASVRMVGPGLWEPPAEPPDWLAAIDRPLVLVSTSSEYQNDARLIEAAFAALAKEDVFVVATAPSVDPAKIRVPANARVERFVPHGPLLARAAAVVCHGGMGITQRALAAGVPVCAVPFGRDQHEVARRLEVSGAGVRLPSSKLSADRIRDAVRCARSKQAGAARIAAAFAKAGGVARATDELEDLLRARQASRLVAPHVVGGTAR